MSNRAAEASKGVPLIRVSRMPADIGALLGQAPLFRALPHAALEAVARACVRRTFLKGTILFHKDETDRALYVIASGRVRIYVPGESGREVTLAICGPGETVGELTALDGLSRSAFAEAVDDVVTYYLHYADFVRVLDISPPAEALISILAARLRRASDNVESMALLDVHGRLAQRLLELADRYGRGQEIDLDLSQTDLASLVGTSRETLNKALAAFRRQGLIKLRGQRILIKEPDALRRRIQ